MEHSNTRKLNVEVFPQHTTNRTMQRDLQRSLSARVGVAAGTTWGDFVAAVEALGIRESDPLGSIEFGIGQTGNGRIGFDLDEFGNLELREGR